MTSREAGTASRHPLVAALFLACAIVLGGGGSPSPGTEILLQLVFVAAALAWLWLPAPHGSVPIPRSRTFWLICALVLVLPLAQLVPLPPGVWTALDGQGNRAAALALVGREQSWQPLSHSPPAHAGGLAGDCPRAVRLFRDRLARCARPRVGRRRDRGDGAGRGAGRRAPAIARAERTAPALRRVLYQPDRLPGEPELVRRRVPDRHRRDRRGPRACRSPGVAHASDAGTLDSRPSPTGAPPRSSSRW